MATQNGINYAKAIDPSSDNILSQGVYGGRVRVAIDTFTFTGEGIGEVINVAKLPEGARVLSVSVFHGAMDSSVTLGVGYGLAGVQYLATTIAGDNAVGRIDSDLLGDYVVGTAADDEIVIVTTAGAAANGTITTHVYYTTD